jgi:hypothetical protein
VLRASVGTQSELRDSAEAARLCSVEEEVHGLRPRQALVEGCGSPRHVREGCREARARARAAPRARASQPAETEVLTLRNLLVN